MKARSIAFISEGGIGDFILHLEVIQSLLLIAGGNTDPVVFTTTEKAAIGKLFIPSVQFIAQVPEWDNINEFDELIHLQWFTTRLYVRDPEKSIIPDEVKYASFNSGRKCGVLSLSYYFKKQYSFRQVLLESAGLAFNKAPSIFFPFFNPAPLMINLPGKFSAGDFIVINNEADNFFGGQQTKVVPQEIWKDIVSELCKTFTHVAEIGKAHGNNSFSQNNYTDLRGATSVLQALSLIYHSAGVVSIEGGVAHLAAAVGRRAVVLYGPTAHAQYGHALHHSLQTGACSACAWTSMDWYKRCILSLDAQCMTGFKGATVAAAAYDVFADHSVIE